MPAPTYSAPVTPADLREPEELSHPALRIAVERARAGSRPLRLRLLSARAAARITTRD